MAAVGAIAGCTHVLGCSHLGLKQFQRARVSPTHRTTRRQIPRAQMGGNRRFDEGADQVRRLLDRDRKELQGLEEIGGAFNAEFDEGLDDKPAAKPAAASTSAPSAGATGAAKPASPFGAPGRAAASPFGSGPRKPLFEPEGLRPDLPADAMKSDPWWKNITLTQVVIVLSFTLIIGLMLATFFVVLKSGGVRFNDN